MLENRKISHIDVDVRLLIMQAVQEILSDPDFGLRLTDEAKTRLRKASRSKTARVIPFAEIKRKYL